MDEFLQGIPESTILFARTLSVLIENTHTEYRCIGSARTEVEVSRWHWFSHCMGPFVRLLGNSPIHSISLDTRSLSSEHIFRILRGL